jgi:hypothetical protein
MLSKLFRELDIFSSDFHPFQGKAIAFPKEDDPSFKYLKESVEKEKVVTTKETWESVDCTIRFSKVTTAPKKVEVTAEDLQKKLKEAVTAEDYELATKLKKELQKKKGE